MLLPLLMFAAVQHYRVKFCHRQTHCQATFCHEKAKMQAVAPMRQ